MRKSAYFALEVLWTLIVSSIVWFLALKNASFDFYHNTDNSLMGIILAAGLILYAILTVCYIIMGAKKVKDWSAKTGIIAVIISAVIGFAGSFAVIYISEVLRA